MKVAAEIRRVDSETGGKWTRDASRARDRIIYNWDQWELFVTGSINKRLMRPGAISRAEYGRNSITKKIPRYEARKSRIISPGARVRVELTRIRPPVSQPRRQFSFFFAIHPFVSRNLSQNTTRTFTLSRLSGYGCLQISPETMMTVRCSPY